MTNLPPQSLIYIVSFIAALAAFALWAPAQGWITFPKGRVVATLCFAIAHAAGALAALPIMFAAFVFTLLFGSYGHGMPNPNGQALLAVFFVLAFVVWVGLTAGEVLLCGTNGIGVAQLRDRRSPFWIALSVSILEICAVIVLPMLMPSVSLLGSEPIAWGAIDRSGNFVVAPSLDKDPSETSFLRQPTTNPAALHENAADYERDSIDGERLGGIIKHNGLEMLPYSEGLALARKEGDQGWGFVDTSGKFVIARNSYDEARSFHQGVASVCWYLESDGTRIISPMLRQMWWGYIDHQGNWTIRPRFASGDSFSEGLACVSVESDNEANTKSERRYGYIDKAGKFVIPPRYVFGHSFKNDKAYVAVHKGNFGRPNLAVLPEKSWRTPPKTADHVAPWDVQQMSDLGQTYVRQWRLGGYYQQQAEADVARCDALLENDKTNALAQAARAAVLSGTAGVATKVWIAEAQKALKLDPKSPLALAVVGHGLSLQGKDKDAVGEFSKCIALEPSNPEWFANRALSYEGTGEFPAAIKDYTQFITMRPNECWGYGSRAHAYLNSNNFNPSKSDVENALRDLDAGLKLDPKNVFAREHHGVALLKKGEYELALADFKKAENLLSPNDPQMVEILSQQADCYGMWGKPDKEKALRAQANKLANTINGK